MKMYLSVLQVIALHPIEHLPLVLPVLYLMNDLVRPPLHGLSAIRARNLSRHLFVPD